MWQADTQRGCVRVCVCVWERRRQRGSSQRGWGRDVSGGGTHKESVALKAIEKRCFLLTRGGKKSEKFKIKRIRIHERGGERGNEEDERWWLPEDYLSPVPSLHVSVPSPQSHLSSFALFLLLSHPLLFPTWVLSPLPRCFPCIPVSLMPSSVCPSPPSQLFSSSGSSTPLSCTCLVVVQSDDTRWQSSPLIHLNPVDSKVCPGNLFPFCLWWSTVMNKCVKMASVWYQILAVRNETVTYFAELTVCWVIVSKSKD